PSSILSDSAERKVMEPVAESIIDDQMSNGAGISVDHLTKRFVKGASGDELLVLDDVSASFQPGAFVSIVGRSGCGKSTLLRTIAGLLTPTRGTAYIGSDPIRAPREELGMVFQEDAVFPWLTVRKNIEYG